MSSKYTGGMICNHRAYCEARELLEDLKGWLAEDAVQEGYSEEVIEQIQADDVEPLEREIQAYEDAVVGNIEKSQPLKNLGRLLIQLRIANGLTEKEVAERMLGVDTDLLARAEKGECRGLSIQDANGILDAIGVKVRIILESVDSYR